MHFKKQRLWDRKRIESRTFEVEVYIGVHFQW